jgi:hypothetical protein
VTVHSDSWQYVLSVAVRVATTADATTVQCAVYMRTLARLLDAGPLARFMLSTEKDATATSSRTQIQLVYSVIGAMIVKGWCGFCVLVSSCLVFHCRRLYTIIGELRDADCIAALPAESSQEYIRAWSCVVGALDWLLTRANDIDMPVDRWPRSVRLAMRRVIFGRQLLVHIYTFCQLCVACRLVGHLQ